MSSHIAERSPALSPIEIQAFQAIIAALNPLTEEARGRLLESAATLLRIEYVHRDVAHRSPEVQPEPHIHSSKPSPPFSADTSMSPKEFLYEKQPQTDVEKIACLAYYLTHYRATAHFMTSDLNALNSEAAQPRFANTSTSSSNAVKMGYLVPSTKGQRQLSAAGERFVLALPDRDAAKEVLATSKRRSRGKKGRPKPATRGAE